MINYQRKNDRSLQNTHTHETYNYKNSSYEKVSNSTKNETKTNKRNIRAHDADSRCRVRVPVDNQRARAQVLRHRDMPLRTSIPEIPY